MQGSGRNGNHLNWEMKVFTEGKRVLSLIQVEISWIAPIETLPGPVNIIPGNIY
jgi:hypothetical protein